VNNYDANLRWADLRVGQLLQLLLAQGELDNTIFLLTSDHGEAFGEHGYTYHGRGVYDEEVHVPLVMRFPRSQSYSGRVPALTSTLDLLPTIFDFLHITYPAGKVQGKSMLPLIKKERTGIHEYVYSTCQDKNRSYLIRNHSYALILYRDGLHRALYDLKNDAEQRDNILAIQPKQTQLMIAAFKEFARTQQRPPLHFLDPKYKEQRESQQPVKRLSDEQRRELKALGYLD
jgi:arylsulfatase A-like enzyme